MKILCFGSLNLDYVYSVDHFVQRGETLSSSALKVYPGGKGLNQALALARAGAPVLMAGAVGEDGRSLLKMLEDAGADVSHVAVLPEEKTGHAIIQNSADGDNCILLYGGANQCLTQEEIEDALRECEPGDILLLQNEINALPEIFETGKNRGLRIALNPSPMNDSIRQLPLEQVDILLVNEIEAQQLLGRIPKETPAADKLADELREKFPRAEIILTLGKLGSIYIRGDRKIHQPIHRVKPVDTTGAGDTFTGYFLAGELAGLDPVESMERSAIAAALAVSRHGAAPSIPLKEEVDSWMPEESDLFKEIRKLVL